MEKKDRRGERERERDREEKVGIIEIEKKLQNFTILFQ